MTIHPFILSLIVGIALIYPVRTIFKRAGIHPWFAFTVLVPLVGPLLATFILAFSRWSNEQ
jgi:hypothetical protein